MLSFQSTGHLKFRPSISDQKNNLKKNIFTLVHHNIVVMTSDTLNQFKLSQRTKLN